MSCKQSIRYLWSGTVAIFWNVPEFYCLKAEITVFHYDFIITKLLKRKRELVQQRVETKKSSGNFFYQKSTIGTTIAATEANNDMYRLQKMNRKVPADSR